jgi:hypothetical protein
VLLEPSVDATFTGSFHVERIAQMVLVAEVHTHGVSPRLTSSSQPVGTPGCIQRPLRLTEANVLALHGSTVPHAAVPPPSLPPPATILVPPSRQSVVVGHVPPVASRALPAGAAQGVLQVRPCCPAPLPLQRHASHSLQQRRERDGAAAADGGVQLGRRDHRHGLHSHAGGSRRRARVSGSGNTFCLAV